MIGHWLLFESRHAYASVYHCLHNNGDEQTLTCLKMTKIYLSQSGNFPLGETTDSTNNGQILVVAISFFLFNGLVIGTLVFSH